MQQRSVEEKVILWVCALSVVTLLPFAIVRLSLGELWFSIIDMVGIALIAALFAYVYVSRNAKLSGIILSVLALTGMALNIYAKGTSEVLFMYPTIVACYFLARPNVALAMSMITLAALLPIMLQELTDLTFVKVYLSMVACSLFTFGFATQRNQQRDRLLFYSTKDSLTGAENRRSMDERLAEAIQIHERTGNSMSLIILDLDRFKQINDTAGHSAGDDLLIRVTNVLASRIRVTDYLFRYGGDEFVVLANSSDLHTASQLAEDLRALVDADEAVSGWQMSISLGVAEYVRGETREAWLKRADEALFESKRQGRNRVMVSHSPAEVSPAS